MSYGVTAFFPSFLVCTRPCVPSKSGVCFPKSHEIPAIKQDFWGAPPPIARLPGWGDSCGVQNFHFCGRASVVQLFSSLWVIHPSDMGFDFIITVPLLPSHCGILPLDVWGIFYWYLSAFFVDGFSAVSCNFDVFVRRDELMSFYSTILSLSWIS